MNRPGSIYTLTRASLLVRSARFPAYSHSPAGLAIAKRNVTTASRNGEEAVNPPMTTLPPPFESPRRDPNHNFFRHLFRLGKTYLVFYKDGLKRVFANRKLLESRIKSLPADDRPSIFRPSQVPKTFSRADWGLFWRVRHDVARLPLFAIVFIIFEESTPLIAYFIDGIMPFTCRLPKQIQRSRQKAEERRNNSLRELGWKYPQGPSTVTAPVARDHMLRSLHLVSTFWDRVNWVPPGLWMLKGHSRVSFLEADDRLLRKSGGVQDLSDEELAIACSERGIDVSSEPGGDPEARRRLSLWLKLTDAPDAAERRKRMAILIMMKQEDWPKTRGFSLPVWDM